MSTIFIVCLMVLNATFNNISVISWRSVLFVEETGGPAKKPVASHWQTLSHNVVHLALIEIQNHNIRCDRHWLHIGANCHTIVYTPNLTVVPTSIYMVIKIKRNVFPPISTTWTTFSHLKPLRTKMTTTYDIGNLGPDFGHVHLHKNGGV